MSKSTSAVECSCYGCVIARQRAGVPAPDQTAAPCDPPGACSSHGRCWTHSEWVDDLAVQRELQREIDASPEVRS
jgi:hypothetical protein